MNKKFVGFRPTKFGIGNNLFMILVRCLFHTFPHRHLTFSPKSFSFYFIGFLLWSMPWLNGFEKIALSTFIKYWKLLADAIHLKQCEILNKNCLWFDSIRLDSSMYYTGQHERIHTLTSWHTYKHSTTNHLINSSIDFIWIFLPFGQLVKTSHLPFLIVIDNVTYRSIWITGYSWLTGNFGRAKTRKRIFADNFKATTNSSLSPSYSPNGNKTMANGFIMQHLWIVFCTVCFASLFSPISGKIHKFKIPDDFSLCDA